MYWSQYPELKKMGLAMNDKLVKKLSEFGEVISPGLVDTYELSVQAAKLFKDCSIDILLIFPFGYTTGTMIVPVIRDINVPIRLINAHENAGYDYKTAETVLYLHHEGMCCIPEYASTLVAHGKRFEVISGHFGQETFWEKLRRCCNGVGAAAAFETCRFAVIGNTYTGMVDMPCDEQRILKVTGQLLCRPEVEEIEEAFKRVTPKQLLKMCSQLRSYYKVDDTVTDQHMEQSAKIAVAFDEIINKYGIDAFGFYWWGEKLEITELRAQAALGVSRLTAMGIPGATEGDIKTGMAMKILNLLGGGGMFFEFFSADYDGEFLMIGHDGPSNVEMADGKPRLTHLEVHHGKTGEGLGIDFNMKPGVCTFLNLTQFGTDKVFKLIYSVGEIIPGDILNIGNPNCRVRVSAPIFDFFNSWCKQGPGHHTALGIGDLSEEIEAFAEYLGFETARV